MSATYRPTDLVRVDVEGAFYAEVLATSRQGLRRGRLEVRPIGNGQRALGQRREILTRQVVGHWRKVR